jgi:hypothetical protein
MYGNADCLGEGGVDVAPGMGVTVFAFDFAGSGKSDREHVSLGFYERGFDACGGLFEG